MKHPKVVQNSRDKVMNELQTAWLYRVGLILETAK